MQAKHLKAHAASSGYVGPVGFQSPGRLETGLLQDCSSNVVKSPGMSGFAGLHTKGEVGGRRNSTRGQRPVGRSTAFRYVLVGEA